MTVWERRQWCGNVPLASLNVGAFSGHNVFFHYVLFFLLCLQLTIPAQMAKAQAVNQNVLGSIPESHVLMFSHFSVPDPMCLTIKRPSRTPDLNHQIPHQSKSKRSASKERGKPSKGERYGITRSTWAWKNQRYTPRLLNNIRPNLFLIF